MPNVIVVHYEEDPESIIQFRLDSIYNWNDHINFTRDAIISMLAGLNDINAITDRLTQNQADIGNMLVPYYGDNTASGFTDLLNTHISIASNIIQAISTGKDITDLTTNWQSNAKDISSYLEMLDSDNWPATNTVDLLNTHMQCTIDEINARASKDWVGDIQAYDKVHKSIVDLAEYFSGGIITKFPEKFVKYDSYPTPVLPAKVKPSTA